MDTTVEKLSAESRAPRSVPRSRHSARRGRPRGRGAAGAASTSTAGAAAAAAACAASLRTALAATLKSCTLSSPKPGAKSRAGKSFQASTTQCGNERDRYAGARTGRVLASFAECHCASSSCDARVRPCGRGSGGGTNAARRAGGVQLWSLNKYASAPTVRRCASESRFGNAAAAEPISSSAAA